MLLDLRDNPLRLLDCDVAMQLGERHNRLTPELLSTAANEHQRSLFAARSVVPIAAGTAHTLAV